jgi:hypothetical protein
MKIGILAPKFALFTSFLVIARNTARSDNFELSVKQPTFGSDLDLFCSNGRNSEFLVFVLVWSISGISSNEMFCRNVTIEAVVNSQYINVAQNAAICVGQDFLWIRRDVCQELSPFIEGENVLELSAHNPDGGRLHLENVEHMISIRVEREASTTAQEDDVCAMSKSCD